MEPIFPRANGRRARQSAVTVGVVLLVTALALPLAYADNLRDKRDAVRQDIAQAEKHVAESSKRLQASNRRLARAETQLTNAQRELKRTESRLAVAKANDARMKVRLAQATVRLRTAERALNQGIARVEAQRAELGRYAAASYHTGDVRLMQLNLLLTATDVDALTVQLSTMESLLGREENLLEKLHAAERELRRKRTAVANARKAVAKQRATAAANLKRQRDLEAKARQYRSSIAALVSERTAARAAAKKAKRADVRRLQALEAEERRIQAAMLARAQRAGGSYNGDTGGFLAWPVSPVRITSPFGMRRHPILGYSRLHAGTDFGAACGTPLRASASGRVAAAHYSSGWGNRVEIDLGKVNGKLMTITYNHMSGFNVRVGKRVRTGDVVGWVGSTGLSTGCHLHFGVYLNGTPVDPMRYF